MKKITRSLAGLLLAIQVNAQTNDTIYEMVRNNCNYTFDYKTSKRIKEYDRCNYGNSSYNINKGDVLCLHLYDKSDVDCYRKLTYHYRNGGSYEKTVNSRRHIVYIDGNHIHTVIVGKLELWLQIKYDY